MFGKLSLSHIPFDQPITIGSVGLVRFSWAPGDPGLGKPLSVVSDQAQDHQAQENRASYGTYRDRLVKRNRERLNFPNISISL